MRIIVYWQAHRPELPVLSCSTADCAVAHGKRIFTVTMKDATPPVIMHHLSKVDPDLKATPRNTARLKC